MPLYEKQEDVDIAIQAAEDWSVKYLDDWKVTHLIKQSIVDVIIEGTFNRKKMLVEFEHKRRYNTVGKYDTMIIAAQKYFYLVYTSPFSMPILAVTWEDFRGFISLAETMPVSKSVMKRIKGNRGDTEVVVVEFDTTDFKEF